MVRELEARDLLPVVRDSARDFVADGAFTLGAALAFHAALSLAPLLVLLVSAAGLVGPQAQAQLESQLGSLVGPRAGVALGVLVEAARAQKHGSAAAAAGSLLLVAVFASSFFLQLQAALNRVWNVEARPGQGWRGFVRKRLRSLGVLVGLAALLLASLVASALLASVLKRHGSDWVKLDLPISLALFMAIFAMLFRSLPDVSIEWRDTWAGALATALLFAVGKAAIGWYLVHGAVGSAMGAAGSFVALLAWMNYSALIFLFGAEVTQSWAVRRGAPIEPDMHAAWIRPPRAGHA
jgi:membrane protein